jgi:predicted porin
MKKNGIIAAAAMACASGAFAQVAGTGQGPVSASSVTLFGVVDVAYAYGDGSLNHVQRLVSGANTSSRLGFRAFEDLGGGLAAGAWLEAGVNVDNGTGTASSTNNQPVTGPGAPNGTQGLMFNRRSTVSLISADWGELRLGRDFTATFRNRDQTDPFGTVGVGASQVDAGSIAGTTSTRASNMVGYFLPAARLGGLFGELQYYTGENASNSPNPVDGSGWQGRLGWRSGPFGIAAAGGWTSYDDRTPAAGEVDVWNVGGHFEFGFGRLTAGYFEDKIKQQTTTLKATGYIVGLVVPVGASDLKFSYSSYGTDAAGDPTTHKLAVGGVYNLSKRTAAYATYAHVENKGPASVGLNGSSTGAGSSSDGFDIGLKHSF